MTPKCDICFNKFDLELRRPKCLPCGHTLCKECLLNPALDKKCPTCRKNDKHSPLQELSADPGDYPDNIFVIQMVEVDDDEDEGGPPLKMIKTEDTKTLPLVRGVEAGRKVVQKLQQVVPMAVDELNRLLESSAAQLRQLEEALEEMERESVEEVTEEQQQLGAQMEDNARLLAMSKCSVLAEEEDEVCGETWRASVQLPPLEHILFPMLVQLRAKGQLAKVDDFADPLPSTAYLGPPGTTVLKIKKKSDVVDGHLKVNLILQDERRWKNVRCLRNVQGLGAEKLLRVVAPQLEELESLDNVSPSFMQAVEKMKSLKRLVIRCSEQQSGYPDLPLQLEELALDYAKESQLRCVLRMMRLRSLAVTNYSGHDMWFPPSRHGRLIWLKVGMNTDQEATMLSLINAYGSSLQELQVVCGVSEDHIEGFYFPDLDTDLAACDLPCLRRLVLARRSDLTPCPEVDACLLQRRAIRKSLANAVDVVCDSCPVSMV